MQFLHTAAFISFGALGQAGEETAEILPGGFAQEDLAGWVVGEEEGAEEGVEIIGRGGEVEPGGGEEGMDVRVEGGHAGYWSGVRDESRAEDSDGRGGHCDFDGVVDVYEWR